MYSSSRKTNTLVQPLVSTSSPTKPPTSFFIPSPALAPSAPQWRFLEARKRPAVGASGFFPHFTGRRAQAQRKGTTSQGHTGRQQHADTSRHSEHSPRRGFFCPSPWNFTILSEFHNSCQFPSISCSIFFITQQTCIRCAEGHGWVSWESQRNL